MVSRNVIRTCLLLVLMLGAGVFAANPPAANAPAARRVVRYISQHRESGATWITVAPIEGGALVKMLEGAEVGKKPVPYLRPNMLVFISTKSGVTGIEVLTEMAVFDGPREMENPRVHVFEGMTEEKFGIQTFQAIIVERFGQKKTLCIPNRPAAGKMAADSDMMDRIKTFAKGDLIELEFTGVKSPLMLSDIDMYRLPLLGEFSKLGQVQEGGKAFAGVWLNVDGAAKGFALPVIGVTPKINDQSIIALSKRLRPGQAVYFTFREVNGRTTLRDLRLDFKMQQTGAGETTIKSSYVRIVMNVDSGKNYSCQIHPESQRADDAAFEEGVRMVNSPKAGVEPPEIGAGTLQKLRTVQQERIDGKAVTKEERKAFGQVFSAYAAAQNEAERVQLEQQLQTATLEISNRFRKEFELRYLTMKSYLTPEQVAAITKFGAQQLSHKANSPSTQE